MCQLATAKGEKLDTAQCATRAHKLQQSQRAVLAATGRHVGQERYDAYRMRLVRGSWEVDHAVEAGKGSAIALVTMPVKLLLCEDVSTALDRHSKPSMHLQGRGQWWGEYGHGAQVSTSQEKDTMVER